MEPTYKESCDVFTHTFSCTFILQSKSPTYNGYVICTSNNHGSKYMDTIIALIPQQDNAMLLLHAHKFHFIASYYMVNPFPFPFPFCSCSFSFFKPLECLRSLSHVHKTNSLNHHKWGKWFDLYKHFMYNVMHTSPPFHILIS